MIVIPARAGSKGFPQKNQKLFEYTIDSIPQASRKDVVVTTDDPFLMSACDSHGIQYIERDRHLSTDVVSTKEVLLDVVRKRCKGDATEDIIMLYLTYPQRIWKEVMDAYGFFKTRQEKSLLCKCPVEKHPYLCYYETDGIHGKKVVKHDRYRRQDYPSAFFASYYIAIMKADFVSELDYNLYHNDTVFFDLEETPVDVDTQEDLDRFIQMRKRQERARQHQVPRQT